MANGAKRASLRAEGSRDEEARPGQCHRPFPDVPGPAETSAKPASETVRTAQGDLVVFDNLRRTADLTLSSSRWVNFTPRLDANGVLACPAAGDYGYAKSQATNAYGQTLKWAFYVGFNGDCGLYTMRVRFRMHLVCSGNILSPWCDHQGTDHAGCSHWTQFPNRVVSLSAPCRYAP
jgi:hypothetical protein